MASWQNLKRDLVRSVEFCIYSAAWKFICLEGFEAWIPGLDSAGSCSQYSKIQNQAVIRMMLMMMLMILTDIKRLFVWFLASYISCWGRQHIKHILFVINRNKIVLIGNKVSNLISATSNSISFYIQPKWFKRNFISHSLLVVWWESHSNYVLTW